MISAIERPIFAYMLANPPSEDMSCSADIHLTNSKGRINLTKERESRQTQYLLSIFNPLSLGLSKSEQNAVNYFIRDIVLAANLSFKIVALSIFESNVNPSDIKFKDGEVAVEHISEGVNINITDAIKITDRLPITIGTNEELDEDELISILFLINKVNRHTVLSIPKCESVNLKKSLDEYEAAMSSFDRRIIFKHLFNSLELATNWDGKDRKGDKFDTEAASVAGISASEIHKWRDFYNRTKHIDRNPKQFAEFKHGVEELHHQIEPLRSTSAKVIIERLKNYN